MYTKHAATFKTVIRYRFKIRVDVTCGLSELCGAISNRNTFPPFIVHYTALYSVAWSDKQKHMHSKAALEATTQWRREVRGERPHLLDLCNNFLTHWPRGLVDEKCHRPIYTFFSPLENAKVSWENAKVFFSLTHLSFSLMSQ